MAKSSFGLCNTNTKNSYEKYFLHKVRKGTTEPLIIKDPVPNKEEEEPIEPSGSNHDPTVSDKDASPIPISNEAEGLETREISVQQDVSHPQAILNSEFPQVEELPALYVQVQ